MQSMGAVGTSENALAESFNATLKRETLRGGHAWPDPATCRREVFRWVTRYNTRRRHSWCGQQPPIIYEQRHAATLGSPCKSITPCPLSGGKAPRGLANAAINSAKAVSEQDARTALIR